MTTSSTSTMTAPSPSSTPVPSAPGGLYGVGADFVGLGDLHWQANAPVLQAADLVQIEPVSGVAQAHRVVVPTDCAAPHAGCQSAVDYLDPEEGPGTSAIGGAQPVSPLSTLTGGRIP